MNKQTQEQPEGDQSGVLVSCLITLMSHCVYIYTEMGLTYGLKCLWMLTR